MSECFPLFLVAVVLDQGAGCCAKNRVTAKHVTGGGASGRAGQLAVVMKRGIRNPHGGRLRRNRDSCRWDCVDL